MVNGKGKTVYDIWLSLAIGPGGAFGGLFDDHSDACGIYGEAPGAWADTPGISDSLRRRLDDKDLSEADRIARFCEKNGIETEVFGYEGYPSWISGIKNPPYLIYRRGTLSFPEIEKKLRVAIVGTRDMSAYGMRSAYRIAYEAASAGAVIVSGMARGIDGTAAAAALAADGLTLAVTGCGPDIVYPREHEKLAEMIAGSGAVISEFPPGSPPVASHFPVRNRLISGLSHCTAVIEAAEKSGAMLTADIASNQGRAVFALPGRIDDPLSAGPSLLLRRGAGILLGAEDILSRYSDALPGAVDADAFARATLYSEARPEVLEECGVRMPRDAGGDGVPGPAAAPAARERAGGAKTGAGMTRKEIQPPEGELRDFWSAVPRDVPVSPDSFSGLGYTAGRAMKLLSMLEISGYITGIPGGMYIRRTGGS